LSEYRELAARRFRQYKWERRKVAFEKKMMTMTLSVFQQTVPLLEQAGLTRKRTVEKVSVE
jgi:hypothetical protein